MEERIEAMLRLRLTSWEDVCWTRLSEDIRRPQVLGKPHPQVPTTAHFLAANAHRHTVFHVFTSLMSLMPPPPQHGTTQVSEANTKTLHTHGHILTIGARSGVLPSLLLHVTSL